MTTILFTVRSSNAKTGPIPVSTTSNETCPAACPLRGNGCYAEQGGLGFMWRAMSAAGPNASAKNGAGTIRTIDWEGLCAAVGALPAGQVWRHNQAGDLPHNGEIIDAAKLEALVGANAWAGARGFTYTHHDMALEGNRDAVEYANANGFTVNLSANNLEHADELKALAIGPVVVVLPASVEGNQTIETPAGNRVVVCPATYRDDVTCSSCQLCQRQRDVIVGFPAHGAQKAKASTLAKGN